MDYSFLVGVHDRMRTPFSQEGEKMNFSRLASDDTGPEICRGGDSGRASEFGREAIDRVQGSGDDDIDRRVDLKTVWARYDAEAQDESQDLLQRSNRVTGVSRRCLIAQCSSSSH